MYATTRYEKRELVKQAYPNSPKWASKVARMSDNQIFAIFIRLMREGKIR